KRLQQAGATVAAPQLTATSATRLVTARDAIDPRTAVRADGKQVKARTDESVTQLTSARWRSAAPAWEEQATALDDLATASGETVRVTADDVNFFANSGRLQLTVRNTLPVAVEDLRVHLTPTSPRLSIDEQPEPLRIGANSRQVVTVQATAHGPGLVLVGATVTTRDGDPVAKPTALRVKVQPTGNSIYWVVGVGAALLLVAGTWRSLRQSRRRRALAQNSPAQK
uniref:DUF6049 family protein n=1 Tax=Kribbia dieselivorans TaxID=331526 RepID=UPI001470727A